MQEMFAPFMRYAEFSGRSRRKEYWLFALFHGMISGFILFGFIGALVANKGLSGLSSSALNFLTIFIFWTLATIIPNLAVTVRRLHDINFSGWALFVNFIPLIGPFILLIMMLIDGTTGPNKHGADPKERGDYWWEGDGGPPEGYREPAFATGGETSFASPATARSSGSGSGPAPISAPALSASRGFGRRTSGFNG
jgi:uncharacterized membrane protein YhaH (DUF805 family)